MEFFRLTQDIPNIGKVGDVIPLETNMRPAGGYTPDLINFANSVNCYQVYADVMAFDENRQDMSMTHYYAACASRRDEHKYVHSDEDILNKYYGKLCAHGRYPIVLSGAMGDRYFMAKFDNMDEVNEYRDYCEAQL